MMPLAMRLTWRNLKSGELGLLATALVLAVVVVSTVAIFTTRLEATLGRQSNSLLGADLVVRSSRAVPPVWADEARASGLATTATVQFASMVAAGDNLQLAAVRAVTDGYPLRGEVEISRTPFAVEQTAITIADGIPAAGEVWVDSRLLPLLGLELGGRLAIGEADFAVTRVIIAEPDAGNPFGFIGAGLMMNLADLERTAVIQPGSRVQYQLLLAGPPDTVAEFRRALEPQLSEHERLLDVQDTNRGLARTLGTGRQFLLLAAVMGVLLAGIAIAISARQFAHRHTDQVALLKSFGIATQTLRGLYFSQLLLLATGASALGLVTGEILQRVIAWLVLANYDIDLVAADASPYLVSVLCGYLCLLCFALPALWPLAKVPPLKILRRDLTVATPALAWQAAFAAVAVIVLTLLFGRDLALAASVLAALAVVSAIAVVCAWALLAQSRKVAARAGSVWRLATANLYRRMDQSLTQLVVFSLAILLLVTMTVTRQSLIRDWQMQIPADAPNHFLVNVPPEEVVAVERFFRTQEVAHEPFYPMVRGRLTAIGAQTPAAGNTANGDDQPREGLNREANLTWAGELASDNEVVAGAWWDTWQPPAHAHAGVSVEVEFAERAGIELGDDLEFSIGGLPLRATVASLRQLDWRSMKPNFFFIFEPGSLDDFAATYITSFYLPSERKVLINDLILAHPTSMVIEIDKILRQIQTIVRQVSNGVLLVLVMILSGGLLVMASAVNASLALRQQEVGLLRALGSPRGLMLKSLGIEFALLGLISGVIAATGAEILLLCLQHFVLETPLQPHWGYWLATPVLSAAALSAFGVALLYRTLNTPPAVILREAT